MPGGNRGRRRFFVAPSPPTLPSDAGTPANLYTTNAVSTRHGRSPRIDVLAAAQNGRRRRRHPFEKAHIAVCVPAEPSQCSIRITNVIALVFDEFSIYNGVTIENSNSISNIQNVVRAHNRGPAFKGDGMNDCRLPLVSLGSVNFLTRPTSSRTPVIRKKPTLLYHFPSPLPCNSVFFGCRGVRFLNTALYTTIFIKIYRSIFLSVINGL